MLFGLISLLVALYVILDNLTDLDLNLRTAGPGVVVWVGAEADAVTTLRTHLLTEAGCDRRLLDAVAYWRRGRAES